MDGCVAIYKRDDGSDLWQYRLRVPEISNRYLRRSSKTKNFAEAKKIAIKEWSRLCFLKDEGLAVFSKTFGEVAQVVLAEQEDRVKRGIITDGHWSYRRTVIRRYLIPFFGSMQMNAISQSKVDDYWKWRMDYWSEGDGKGQKSVGIKSKSPSYSTLQHDVQIIRKIFYHAENRNWCDKKDIPQVNHPQVPETRRRAVFSEKQWDRLLTFMRKWAERPQTKWQKLTRHRLRYRAMAMYHSGMRTVESSNLTWGDIGTYVDGDGTEYCELWVQGKRKRRRLIAKRNVHKTLMEWKKKAKFAADNDYVFAKTTGKRPTTDDSMFRQILTELNLLTDRIGQPRALTSLRHSYATNQIVNNRVDLHLLASNMGTSIQMIEKHYGHLEPVQRAAELAGRGTHLNSRKKNTRANRTE
ncbi:MAG: integrase [Paracoccaceae bacterium]|jgi:integrase